MQELFLELVQVSLTGSLFVLAVMLVRVLFRKAPKWLFCLLWGVVALRLICPISIESDFSLVPDRLASGQIISNVGSDYIGEVNIIYENNAGYSNAVEAGRQPIYSDSGYYVVTEKDSFNAPATVAETVFPILSWIWLAGMVLMLTYTAVSYLALKRKMEEATLLRDNIWQCEQADSPFVLGIIKPRIYLPYKISDSDMDNVIAHELAHIHRKDHWWKPIGFLLLSVHWFNPVMWVAYVLLCRDIEAACDEKVIKHMEKDEMRAYSTALLHCSVHRRRIAACPLAFGEVGVKERIKRVMNYKKPAFWIIILAIVVSLLAGVLLLTNPTAKNTTLMGAYYEPSELLYTNKQVGCEHTLYSQFCITADYWLYAKQEGDEDWEIAQQMEKYPLTVDELKEYAYYDEGWHQNYNFKEITDAYILYVEDQHFFLVMQTKNGDTLLGYVWEDVSERGQGASDDTSMEYLYKLESEFSNYVFHTNFFSLSLRNSVGETDCFHSYRNDKNPGFMVVGFMADPDEEAAHGYNDMGYAVFQANETGYRLLNYHVYDNAANENNGILFCSDPAILSLDDELTNAVTYDVILSCNENLDKIQREYYKDDELVLQTADTSIGGSKNMSLFCWDEMDGPNLRVKQYYLDSNGNQIDLDEFNPASGYKNGAVELIPGTTYVPYQCIYMNPLSSYAAIAGDSGCTYLIGEDSFTTLNRNDRNFVSIIHPDLDTAGDNANNIIPVTKWEWQEFPYTDEEWASLYWPDDFNSIEKISDYFDRMYYQPLTPGKFLLSMDESLWLVELSADNRVGTYIWCIYSLVPESTMGFAQWEYAPALSSRLPVFRFEFDMEYTSIQASCDTGLLVPWETPGKTSNTVMTYEEGCALYWSPSDEDGVPVTSAKILFTVMQGDTPVYQGNIYLESYSGSNDRRIYDASLIGAGMYLAPNMENEGAVISTRDPAGEAEPIQLIDLTQGKLEIPIEELGQYAFYTNSTKISVKVKSDLAFEGGFTLIDVSQNNAEILYHDVNTKEKSCIFSYLTSARLYRLESTGLEGCTVVISEK